MGEPRLPKGLRWTCSGCGACCDSGFRLGPVEPEVVARLEAEDIGGRWAPAAEGWYDRGPDGLFLRQTEGRCVFLRDDRLCAVHALIGADAKPGFCREFPYHFVDDPRGTVAVVRSTCQGFPRTFREGPVVDPTDAAAADVARALPRRRFAPESVEVVPGHRLSVDRYLALEDGVLDGISDDLDPEAQVRAIRARLYEAVGAEPPPVRAPQRLAAEEAVLRALRIVLGQAVAGPGGEPHQRVFAAAALARLARAHDAVVGAIEGGEQGRAPVLGLPSLAHEGRAYAALNLRSFLLAKRFDGWGGLPAGIGAFHLGLLVGWRTAEPGARVAAEGSAARDTVGAQALGAAWREWERLAAVGLVDALLRRARPALVDLFLHAG